MTYEEAIEARVSVNTAIYEMKLHGFIGDEDGREVFDCRSGETVARIGRDGFVAGADVLAWLGY